MKTYTINLTATITVEEAEQPDAPPPPPEPPKPTWTPEDLLDLVPPPPERIRKRELLEEAGSNGWPRMTAFRTLERLINTRRVFIHREERPGDKPLQYVARFAPA